VQEVHSGLPRRISQPLTESIASSKARSFSTSLSERPMQVIPFAAGKVCFTRRSPSFF